MLQKHLHLKERNSVKKRSSNKRRKDDARHRVDWSRRRGFTVRERHRRYLENNERKRKSFSGRKKKER